MAKPELDPIFNRLNNAPNYHPMTASTFADWALEAGDYVQISRGGQVFTAPIHISHVKWNGSQTVEIESSGSRERDPVAKMSARKYGSNGNDMRGGYRATKQGQGILSEVWSSDSTMYSVISQTSSQVYSEMGNLSSGLYSSIEQTASSIRSDVWGSESTIYSHIEQTKDGLLSEVASTKSGLYTAIRQTASSITMEVRSTASNLYSRILQDARSITLQAANINIEGNIRLSDVLGISGSNATFKKVADFTPASGGAHTTINGGLITTGQINVQNSGSIVFQGSTNYTLTNPVVKTMIKTASIVNTNTLRLTRFDGTNLDFSRAASLTGSWGSQNAATGKILTVTGNPVSLQPSLSYTIGFTGETASVVLGLSTNGAATESSTGKAWLNVPLRITSGGTTVYTKDINLNAGVAYNNGFDAGAAGANLQRNAISTVPAGHNATPLTPGTYYELVPTYKDHNGTLHRGDASTKYVYCPDNPPAVTGTGYRHGIKLTQGFVYCVTYQKNGSNWEQIGSMSYNVGSNFTMYSADLRFKYIMVVEGASWDWDTSVTTTSGVWVK